LLEMPGKRIRDEPRAHGVHMPVAIAALLMDKKAVRYDQMKVVFGARHRDVEQATLLFDLWRAADPEI
jgi:hypothetical protein